MRNLTLADLGKGLGELLDNRAKSLEATQTGKLYGPILAAKRKAIEHALKVVLETKTGDLSETDAQHDGLGGAIWHFHQANCVGFGWVSSGARRHGHHHVCAEKCITNCCSLRRFTARLSLLVRHSPMVNLIGLMILAREIELDSP